MGPCGPSPTRTFFYGMEPGEEILGRDRTRQTLEIRLITVGETGDDGEVKVFFELTVSPVRCVSPNAKLPPRPRKRLKADASNPAHVGAPNAGAVATVAAKAGAKVKAGDLLLTIEAMKMETGIARLTANAVVEGRPCPARRADRSQGSADRIRGLNTQAGRNKHPRDQPCHAGAFA